MSAKLSDAIEIVATHAARKCLALVSEAKKRKLTKARLEFRVAKTIESAIAWGIVRALPDPDGLAPITPLDAEAPSR